MKKTSLIKKLGLGLASTAAVVPLVISATACSDTKAITVRYISYDNLYEGSKADGFDKDPSLAFKNAKEGHFSKDQLLLGSKKFFKGNYILFVGSNGYALNEKGEHSSTDIFFSGLATPNRKVNQWFGEKYKESIWYNDVMSANILSTKFEKDFGFVTFIDNFDFKFYDENNHQIFITDDADQAIAGIIESVGPFDKWTPGRITQTRILNKELFNYEWDKDEKITEDDYIRQDDQAKAYRAFINRGAAMFPTNDKRKKTFDNSEHNSGVMAVYKDGRLVDLVDLPTEITKNPTIDFKETTTLFGTINKYFTKEEEKK